MGRRKAKRTSTVKLKEATSGLRDAKQIARKADARVQDLKRQLRAATLDVKQALKLEAERERFVARAVKGWSRQKQRQPNQTKHVSITSEQLRAARGVLGLSQSAFADFLQLSKKELRRLEDGDATLLTVETARQINKNLRDGGISLVSTGFYMGDGGPGIRVGRRGVDLPLEKSNAPAARASARRKVKPMLGA